MTGRQQHGKAGEGCVLEEGQPRLWLMSHLSVWVGFGGFTCSIIGIYMQLA